MSGLALGLTMRNIGPIVSDNASPELLADLAQREAAVWIVDSNGDIGDTDQLVRFLHLPWRLVILDTKRTSLAAAVGETSSLDPLARFRGFPQVVSENPTEMELPPSCLPIYLLNGLLDRAHDPFQNKLRRFTMLNELRRSAVRRVLIICLSEDPSFPTELHEVVSSDFRPSVSICSQDVNAKLDAARYRDLDLVLTVFDRPPLDFIEDVLLRYHEAYSPSRSVVRMRHNIQGDSASLDISDVDDPERPILSALSPLKEADLITLLPDELSKEDFIDFFRDPAASWRPYAAALPWERSREPLAALIDTLQRIEARGASESALATIAAESGAGGTTFIRQLSWQCASRGYPVLVATQSPLIPTALRVSNFLNRVHRISGGDDSYEAPWLIVFDRVHWEHNDLHAFLRDIKRDGRPVCLLVVTGPRRGTSILHARKEERLHDLTHMIDRQSARDLGRHINRFLAKYGMDRTMSEWDMFHQHHSVRHSFTHFWIALSFWVQGQYDLSETIQERVFHSFSEQADNVDVQQAILDIAALGAEGVPTPMSVLSTPAHSRWPVTQLLEDALPELAYMGLFQLRTDEGKYWAIVHDILAQQLLNAVFQSQDTRKALDLPPADEVAHLRLEILRRISRRLRTGEQSLVRLGEQFAMTILKVDPDAGRAIFGRYWREVMSLLDDMPGAVRDTSRVFRHHIAISRRRIAKLEGSFYGVSDEDRESLLQRAIDDLEYAMDAIPFTPGAESDMNIFNTLALAYFDYAELVTDQGNRPNLAAELRAKGNQAARRVFDEDPTNSFAIETYVRNLFSRVDLDPDRTIEYVVEALNILFSALVSSERAYRIAHLERLAQQGVRRLFHGAMVGATRDITEPASALDVLKNAWITLTRDSFYEGEVAFEQIAPERLEEALVVLSHDAGKRNKQVVRLRYEITCIARPSDVGSQMELVEALQGPGVSPQLRLEYAILLYQMLRPVEGNDEFYKLRQLWRQRDYVVEVPERLRWLRDSNGDVRTVHAAAISSGTDGRPMAAVSEFRGKRAPFRPEEFGVRGVVRSGTRFACAVTFGHNGPLLRPTTAAPRQMATR